MNGEKSEIPAQFIGEGNVDASFSISVPNKKNQSEISVLELLDDNGTNSTKNMAKSKIIITRVGTRMEKNSPAQMQKNINFSDHESINSYDSNSSDGSSIREPPSFAQEKSIVPKKSLVENINKYKQADRLSPSRKMTQTGTPKTPHTPGSSNNLMNFDYRFSVYKPNLAILFEPKKKEAFSVVKILEVARRFGILKRSFAYEQYISKDQFLMVKDVSTGRFDLADEKRFQQLEKLKSKMLFSAVLHRKNKDRRRRTILWNQEAPSLKAFYQKLKKNICRVFTPNNKFRTIWDCLITFLIFYDLIMMPLQLAFDIPFLSLLFFLDLIVDIPFILDILVNFNTGYYSKGLLVMDRRKIAFHYMKRWFWIDFVTAFPYSYIFPDSNDYDIGGYEAVRMGGFARLSKVIKILRVFKMRRNFQKLESYVDVSPTTSGIFGFLKISLVILLIAHWLSCIWHYVSVFELQYHPESWIIKAELIDSEWIDRYITALYWAAMTMITVGYGDITPGTRIEKVVAIAAMLVASVVFAYTMNRINVILAGLETNSEQYKKAFATISDYMKKKRVEKELQIKIKKYLEYALEVETSLDSNEACLDAYLNQSLKDELITQIYGKILLDKPVFKQFGNDFIARAAVLMREKIYSPEDVIFLEIKHKDTNLYFINVGKVEIFHFYSSTFLKTLTRGNFFGEPAFFTGTACGISARSVDFSTVYYMKRDEFLCIVDEFPFEKEKFHAVKDKIKLYNDHALLDAKCFSCGEYTHTVTTCPRIHLSVSKEKYIQGYLEHRNKFMSEYMRLGKGNGRHKSRVAELRVAALKIQQRIAEGAYLHLSTKIIDGSPDSKSKTSSEYSLLSGIPILKPVSIDDKKNQGGTLHLGDKKIPLKPGNMDDQIQIQYEISQAATPKRFSLVFTPLIEEEKNTSKSRIDLQEKAFEDDIDKIQDFTFYFPHNNLSKLFPHASVMHSGTTMFDFITEHAAPKSTLKKFLNIMKNRMSVKRELNSQLQAKKLTTKLSKSALFAKDVKKGKVTTKLNAKSSKSPRRSVLVVHPVGDSDADNSGAGSSDNSS